MRGSVGEIVSYEQILVIAAPFVPTHWMVPGLAQRFTSCEAEEPVAAVRGRVLGDGVLVVLLEQEDAGGILAAKCPASGSDRPRTSQDPGPGASGAGRAPSRSGARRVAAWSPG